MPKPASKPAPKTAPKATPKTAPKLTAKTAPAPKKRAVSPALEDYLEAILNLSRNSGSARSRDISEALHVHKSTVTAALKTLAGMKLVNYSPYEAVTLTPEGGWIGEDVAGRHRALQDFFVGVLRVDPATAAEAACGMEHSVPREIVDKLADFAATMGGCPRLEEAGKAKTTSPGLRPGTAGKSAKGATCAACRTGEAKAKPAGTRKAKAVAATAKAATALAGGDLLEDCYSRR